MPPEPKKPATLLEAVCAVQAKAPKLFKTKTAKVKSKTTGAEYQYSFADLQVIVEQMGPLMAEQGLVFQAFPTMDAQGNPALRYRLSHAPSGESDEDTMPLILPQRDMQGIGSALTYSRRYALCSAMNIVADEDDDGQAAKAPTAGDIARAKANMSQEAKNVQAEAVATFKLMPPGVLSEATFNRYMDATGYTVEGMQRLVDYLKAAKDA
jgi:hypothetical protein